jgi:lipid-binding SYLF domain-containing protein
MSRYSSLLFCLLVFAQPSFSQDKKAQSLMTDAAAAKTAFLEQDKGLSKFFNSAAGYVIFPNVGKGGLGIGGAAGQGILYEKGAAKGKASLTQVTIGLQAGGQAYREVIFFESQKELDNFKKNKFEFAAQVSAVAASAGAAANAKYNEGVAVFTMAKKGLMYEASVGGQKFKFELF